MTLDRGIEVARGMLAMVRQYVPQATAIRMAEVEEGFTLEVFEDQEVIGSATWDDVPTGAELMAGVDRIAADLDPGRVCTCRPDRPPRATCPIHGHVEAPV